jgi:hypothetical protein
MLMSRRSCDNCIIPTVTPRAQLSSLVLSQVNKIAGPPSLAKKRDALRTLQPGGSEAYDLLAMAQIDTAKETQRLAALYAGMEAGELAAIAADASSLTVIAWQVLQAEMARRGMEPLPSIITPEAGDAQEPIAPAPVMVRRFRDLPEASIAKSILDSAGIENYLADDNLVRMDWFYSNLIGGIKLFVREQDSEEANNLLSQGVPEKFDVDTPGEYEQPRCPKCQSFDVSFDGLDKPSTYAALFVNLPIPITNKDWKCHSCGHRWKEDVATAPPDRQA